MQATLDLLLDEASGIWHLTNAGAVSFHDLACEAAERKGLDKSRIRIAETEASDTSLASNRGFLLRPLDQALARLHRRSRDAALRLSLAYGHFAAFGLSLPRRSE